MRHEIFSYDDNSVFGINNIGYSADVNVTHFGPGQRDLYIIHYVISGKGYFNGCKVSKGQGFLITPGMAEHYYPDTENPWAFLWVIFNNPIAEKLFEKYNANSKTHIFEYRNTYAIIDAINHLSEKNHCIHLRNYWKFFCICLITKGIYKKIAKKLPTYTIIML